MPTRRWILPCPSPRRHHRCGRRARPLPAFPPAAPGSVGVRVGHAWRPRRLRRSASSRWTRTSNLGSSCCRPSCLPQARRRATTSGASAVAAGGVGGAVDEVAVVGVAAPPPLAATSVIAPSWASGRSEENGGGGNGDRVGRGRIEPREVPEQRIARAEPEPPPPPAPRPPAREPDDDTGGGESFWSKGKRGLTGGT